MATRMSATLRRARRDLDAAQKTNEQLVSVNREQSDTIIQRGQELAACTRGLEEGRAKIAEIQKGLDGLRNLPAAKAPWSDGRIVPLIWWPDQHLLSFLHELESDRLIGKLIPVSGKDGLGAPISSPPIFPEALYVEVLTLAASRGLVQRSGSVVSAAR